MPQRKTDLPTHLPLPGSHPVGVHQHRTPTYGLRRGCAWVKALLMLAVIGAAGVTWAATRTPVTVVVNGEARELHTHRQRVEGVLRQAGIPTDESLAVTPPLDARIGRDAVIVVADLRPVTILADGERLTLQTQHTDPTQIITEAGIPLSRSDGLHVVRQTGPTSKTLSQNPALAEVPSLPQEIQIVRARTVIVQEVTFAGASRVSFVANSLTVGEALTAAGYTIYEADTVTPAFDTPLTQTTDPTIEVTITRSVPVTLSADGQQQMLRTHAPTVGALLAENGLALTGEDYITPALDSRLTPGTEVRLVRVQEQTRIEEEVIPFETTYVPRPDLELDTLVEVQPGQTGLLNREVRIRRENGQIVSRVTGAEWLARRPEARVLGYGTRIVVREVMTEVGPVAYWRKMRMLATSYSPSTAGDKEPGDPYFGLSGTGDPMRRGIVATDPRVIPLYTRLWVPDYGFGRALDVGGAVKGMRIDLGYTDDDLVLWNQWVDVYLVLPIPATDQIVYVLPDAQINR